MQIAAAVSGVIQGSLKILTSQLSLQTVNSFLIAGYKCIVMLRIVRSSLSFKKPFLKIFRQQLFNKPSTHKNIQIHHSTKTSKL